MILEIAKLNIRDNLEKAFENDFLIAEAYIKSIKGYKGHTLQKSLKAPSTYLLLVNWDTIEDHQIGFRTSNVYKKWKALLHHYYEPFPSVEYYANTKGL